MMHISNATKTVEKKSYYYYYERENNEKITKSSSIRTKFYIDYNNSIEFNNNKIIMYIIKNVVCTRNHILYPNVYI